MTTTTTNQNVYEVQSYQTGGETCFCVIERNDGEYGYDVVFDSEEYSECVRWIANRMPVSSSSSSAPVIDSFNPFAGRSIASLLEEFGSHEALHEAGYDPFAEE